MTDGWAHLGLAGVLDEDQVDMVSSSMPFARTTVSDDRLTTFAGALGSIDGMVVSIGTGSFVVAKRGSNLRYFGGWGYQLSDQASGYWLGQKILRRCLLALDGLAPPSDLTQEILADYNNKGSHLIHFMNGAQPSDVASLAPRVVRAAQAGDRHASAIMRDGASYIIKCLHAADWTSDTPICLTGGIGPHYGSYLDEPMQKLLCPPKGPPLDGAMHLALRQATKGLA